MLIQLREHPEDILTGRGPIFAVEFAFGSARLAVVLPHDTPPFVSCILARSDENSYPAFLGKFSQKEVVPLWHKNCAKLAQPCLQPIFAKNTGYPPIAFWEIFPKMLPEHRLRRRRRAQCLPGRQRQTALIQLRESLLATFLDPMLSLPSEPRDSSLFCRGRVNRTA
jgi:hypothetical protein